MKKLMILLLLAAMLLTGCDPALPQAEATEPPTQAPTAEPTQPPTEPPTEPPKQQSPALPEELLAPEHETLSYEEFFAEDRTYDDGYNSRIMICGKYGFQIDEKGVSLTVRTQAPTTVYTVPNTTGLEFAGYSRPTYPFAFVDHYMYAFRKDLALLKIDMVTGEQSVVDMGFDGMRLEYVRDPHPDVLYFVVVDGETGTYYRMYLPDMTLDVLWDEIPAEAFLWDNGYISSPGSTQGDIFIQSLNPEFYHKMLELLKDPEQAGTWEMPDTLPQNLAGVTPKDVVQMAKSSLKSAGTAENAVKSVRVDIFSLIVQEYYKVPMLQYLRWDAETGEVTVELRSIDNNSYGTVE